MPATTTSLLFLAFAVKGEEKCSQKYVSSRTRKQHVATIVPAAKPNPSEAARLKEREELERARGPGR